MLANVLGVAPENQRQDRDSFIYINNSNIDRSNLANLQPLPGFVAATVYDYASVTHVYSKVSGVFYARQLYRQVLLRACISYGNSVCLFVRLSRPGTDSSPGEIETPGLHCMIA